VSVSSSVAPSAAESQLLSPFFETIVFVPESTMKRLGDVAMRRWGLITTAQAEQVGVSRKVMSRLAATGSVARVAHGVYRMAGAPELEHEEIFATWLALGGAALPATAEGVPALVAAGRMATLLHGIGDFYPDGFEFLVPDDRVTRLPAVRLRRQCLDPSEVTFAQQVPVLTVERTLADLIEQHEDMSLVTDVLADALRLGRYVSREQLGRHLAPMASANGFSANDGSAFASDLLQQAAPSAPIHA
jgi:predicted transcriptional regulator of viral defense system